MFLKQSEKQSSLSSQGIWFITDISVILKVALILYLRVVLTFALFRAFHVSFLFDQAPLAIFTSVFKATCICVKVALKVSIFILIATIFESTFIGCFLFGEGDHTFSISNAFLETTLINEILSYYFTFCEITFHPYSPVFSFCELVGVVAYSMSISILKLSFEDPLISYKFSFTMGNNVFIAFVKLSLVKVTCLNNSDYFLIIIIISVVAFSSEVPSGFEIFQLVKKLSVTLFDCLKQSFFEGKFYNIEWEINWLFEGNFYLVVCIRNSHGLEIYLQDLPLRFEQSLLLAWKFGAEMRKSRRRMHQHLFIQSFLFKICILLRSEFFKGYWFEIHLSGLIVYLLLCLLLTLFGRLE